MNDSSDVASRAESTDQTRRRLSRRRLLAAAGGVGAAGLAGCGGLFGTGDGEDGDGGDGTATADPTDIANFRGSGPLVEQRGQPGGTSITDLPDLSGSLNFYLGGGESGLYLELLEKFETIYPDFETENRLDASSTLANTIIEENEAGTSPADLFLAVDAGSLVAVADAGATTTLPSAVTEEVDQDFYTDRWVGFAGRARAMPYNTNALSESDLPETVQDLPGMSGLSNAVGWAPTYGAFQSFVTAMRLLRGEDETRQWLTDMQDLGVRTYDDEFRVSNAVADGALSTGFANHYYALRVLNSRANAPIDLHFTSGDAGALINVSGAAIIRGTGNQELAENFVRHLVSAEAQEFFATRTFAYPTVPEVQPPGGLPTADELNPPDIDLTELSDIQPTLDLLRETGVL
jgi:iron(III) transport system substrate-binding protein